jgi:hypothetical protein
LTQGIAPALRRIYFVVVELEFLVLADFAQRVVFV